MCEISSHNVTTKWPVLFNPIEIIIFVLYRSPERPPTPEAPAETASQGDEDEDDDGVMVPRVKVAEDGSLIIDEERSATSLSFLIEKQFFIYFLNWLPDLTELNFTPILLCLDVT